jgi:hypothetical protein
MSFSFVITCKDGKLSVPDDTFQVPDGEITVGGHVDSDGGNESLYVQRKDSSRVLRSSAQSYHR